MTLVRALLLASLAAPACQKSGGDQTRPPVEVVTMSDGRVVVNNPPLDGGSPPALVVHFCGQDLGCPPPSPSIDDRIRITCHDPSLVDVAPLHALDACARDIDLDLSHTGVRGIAGVHRVTRLNVSLTPLDDLTSLRDLPLVTLDASGTRVKSVAPLASMSTLEDLDIHDTAIADLDPIAVLPIRQLDISGTKVARVDAVAGLSRLERLTLARTTITDLTPLSRLSALKEIDLSETSISDLTPIASLPALETLTADHTNVGDLRPLATTPRLRALSISETAVTDLAPLAHVATLESLSANGTRIADVRPIAALSRLRRIRLAFTLVHDASAFYGASEQLDLDLDQSAMSKSGCATLRQRIKSRLIECSPYLAAPGHSLEQAIEGLRLGTRR